MNTYDEKYHKWFMSQIDKMGDWDWNDTRVDAVLVEHNQDVEINRLVSFFDSIDAPLLKKGNIIKLYNASYTTVADIIIADEGELISVIGMNGSKIYAGLREKLTDIPLYRLLGAFSNERGLGVRKMKKLQQGLGHNTIMYDSLQEDDVTRIDGFEGKTAQKVLVTINEFHVFINEIKEFFSFDETGGFSTGSNEMDGMKVVFTGFRNADLQTAVENAGGTMQSTVSGKTNILVASNPTSNSGKMKKARDLGVRVIGVEELKNELGV